MNTKIVFFYIFYFQNFINTIFAELMDIVKKYFPNIDPKTYERLSGLQKLYSEWNQKINVISRKDIVFFNQRHLLHSLSIAYLLNFKLGTIIIDVGTGGGFPGIPLAIFFPEVEFYLLDSIAKKCKVAESIKNELHLNNVNIINARAENFVQKADFIVSRAVAPINTLWNWTYKNLSSKQINDIPNGMLCLKGGDLTAEISETGLKSKIWELSDFFEEDFFQTKKLIHLSK